MRMSLSDYYSAVEERFARGNHAGQNLSVQGPDEICSRRQALRRAVGAVGLRAVLQPDLLVGEVPRRSRFLEAAQGSTSDGNLGYAIAPPRREHRMCRT